MPPAVLQERRKWSDTFVYSAGGRGLREVAGEDDAPRGQLRELGLAGAASCGEYVQSAPQQGDLRPERLTKAPFHPVAHHRSAYFAADRKAREQFRSAHKGQRQQTGAAASALPVHIPELRVFL